MPVIVEHPSILTPKIDAKPVLGARHMCIDIETGDAPKEAIDIAIQFWKAPSNMKNEEGIAERRKMAEAKMEEKSALLDGAPIACLAVQTETKAAIFSSIKSKKPVDKIAMDNPPDIFTYKTEREMLIGMREWFDARTTPGTIVSGFNIFNFDLPKIRIAYVRNRINLPKVFQPEVKNAGVEFYDVMKNFLKSFTTEKSGDRYISLEEVEARLGLPSYKDRVSGAEVPRMVAQGKAKEVMTYCLLDALSTYYAFLAMTSQSRDQEVTVG